MATDIAAVQVQLDTTGRIAQDVHCIHCGYNLRSLLTEQSCPECNQPVAMSLRGDLLQFSNPAWLKMLANGMGWIVAGLVLSLTLRWILSLSVPWLLGTWTYYWTAYLPGELIRLVGIWKVTSPEPRLLDTQHVMDARRNARILLIGDLVLNSAMTALHLKPDLLLGVLVMAHGAMLAVGWVSLFVYLVRLARRLSAPGLIRFTWIVCIAKVTVDVLSLSLQIVSLWMILGTGTGIVLQDQLLATIWSLALLLTKILVLALAAIYCSQFRKSLQQSREIVQGSTAVG